MLHMRFYPNRNKQSKALCVASYLETLHQMCEAESFCSVLYLLGVSLPNFVQGVP